MKKTEIFEGKQLQNLPPNYTVSNPKCAFFGTVNDKNTFVKFDDELLSQHILFLGGIGTGKTNAVFQIIHNLRQNMEQKDVMIIFDTKGDFKERFYEQGDIIISNDNSAMGANGRDYWNIFGEIESGTDKINSSINEIAKTLFSKKIEKTNQPFFPTAAKDLFSAVLSHFIRDNKNCNNESLQTLLLSSKTEDIREILKKYPDCQSLVSYIFDDRSPQTQGVFSELQQLSREIFIDNFAKSGTLSMRELVRNKGGKTIFVEYDLGIGNMLSPVYSLLLDMALKEALSRNKSDGNVYVLIDEFNLLPHLQHIDDAVNFGRSQGLKLMIGIQNVDQVYEGYGESRARSLLSGFLTSVCFRVNDRHSKDFIMERHGANRKKDIFMSTVQSRGIVENARDANVVEDWDISNLKRGQAIIGLPESEPFLFKFDKYKN